MRSLIAYILFLTHAHAWDIVTEKESTFLKDKNLSEKEEILAHPSIKKIHTQKLTSDITLIIYLENLGGTKNAAESYYCAAFSNDLKKLIFKDIYCKSVLYHENGKKEVEEASFRIEGRTLIYTFSELSKKFDLSK
jgi:hypothetical protein